MSKLGKSKGILFAAILSLTLFSIHALAGTAPNFKLDTTENKTMELRDVMGEKVVLVSFWALWCKPCRKELSEIEKIHRDYKDKAVAVFSINVDTLNFKSKVQSYVKKLKLDVPVLLDPDSEVIRLYNPRKVMPYTFIIDLAGQIAYTHTGYNSGDEIVLRQKIDEFLSAGAEKESP
jgi:peroxiredoxin